MTPVMEDVVLAKLRLLPPDKQKEAIEFIEFLVQKHAVRLPRRATGRLDTAGADPRREHWDTLPYIEP